jgi:hypothetical protein
MGPAAHAMISCDFPCCTGTPLTPRKHVRVHQAADTAAAPSPRMILPGLPWPQALQGHDDENWPESMVDANGGPTADLLDRYAVIKSMKPGGGEDAHHHAEHIHPPPHTVAIFTHHPPHPAHHKPSHSPQTITPSYTHHTRPSHLITMHTHRTHHTTPHSSQAFADTTWTGRRSRRRSHLPQHLPWVVQRVQRRYQRLKRRGSPWGTYARHAMHHTLAQHNPQAQASCMGSHVNTRA